jgi:type VI secretion system protein ImpB
VHVTYEVEVGDADEIKRNCRLSWASWATSRVSRRAPGRLRDRKFTEVNPDNFDSVLKG